MPRCLVLFFFSLIIFSPISKAQNIPNAGFDSVYIGGIDRLLAWITADGYVMASGSSGDTIQSLWPNIRLNANGFLFSELLGSVSSHPDTSGLGAVVQLRSRPERVKLNGAPFETFITNGTLVETDLQGYPNLAGGGTPFPYRPTLLQGRYRFIDTLSSIDNFGKCVILLKKYNASRGGRDTVAYVESSFDLNPTLSWQPFSIPIPYRTSEIPDSIVVAFFAGNHPMELTELWLDDLSFDFTTVLTPSPTNSNPPLQVYPNPHTGQVSIQSDHSSFQFYRLWDESGRLLKTGPIQPTLILDGLEGSFQLLELQTANGQRSIVKLIRHKE